jgi:hypothetical protein
VITKGERLGEAIGAGSRGKYGDYWHLVGSFIASGVEKVSRLQVDGGQRGTPGHLLSEALKMVQ